MQKEESRRVNKQGVEGRRMEKEKFFLKRAKTKKGARKKERKVDYVKEKVKGLSITGAARR